LRLCTGLIQNPEIERWKSQFRGCLIFVEMPKSLYFRAFSGYKTKTPTLKKLYQSWSTDLEAPPGFARLLARAFVLQNWYTGVVVSYNNIKTALSRFLLSSDDWQMFWSLLTGIMSKVGNEIHRLRDQKQKLLLESANRDELKNRMADMSTFLKKQSTALTEFEEQIVRRLIKKVTICEGKSSVEFKSGLTVNVNE
jgi:hypothetical protein